MNELLVNIGLFFQGLALVFMVPAMAMGTYWLLNLFVTGCAIGIGCL